MEHNIEILGSDLVSQHGFTQVPNFILTNKELGVGAKLYYAMLLKYARDADYCFPGQARLADDIGTSVRSVKTYQDELERAGFLKVTRRGLGKTNYYTLDIRVEQGGKVKYGK